MTNRTTTAKWKNLRRRALHQAQAAGITHCPCTATCKTHTGRRCNVPLDYTTGRRPNSAVPDHVKHHALGGEDSLENLRTICYSCNASDGGRLGAYLARHKQAPQHVQTIDFRI